MKALPKEDAVLKTWSSSTARCLQEEPLMPPAGRQRAAFFSGSLSCNRSGGLIHLGGFRPWPVLPWHSEISPLSPWIAKHRSSERSASQGCVYLESQLCPRPGTPALNIPRACVRLNVSLGGFSARRLPERPLRVSAVWQPPSRIVRLQEGAAVRWHFLCVCVCAKFQMSLLEKLGTMNRCSFTVPRI